MDKLHDLGCGCKGIRYCAICKESDRVQKIRKETESFEDFDCFVYSAVDQTAYRAPSLSASSKLEDIHKCTKMWTSGIVESEDKLCIAGLLLVPEFVNEEEEKYLVDRIDSVEWVQSQSGRRKQDYGPQVNFKYKKVKTTKFHGMPEYADMLLERMRGVKEGNLSGYSPLEMCNLEYEEKRASSIEMHRDDCWIWGDRLISINLLAGAVMTLTRAESRELVFVDMPRRSLLCMASSARYDWMHGVASQHIRGRRIALTMREPSPAFQEGGLLYEEYGRELARIGNIRIPLAPLNTRSHTNN